MNAEEAKYRLEVRTKGYKFDTDGIKPYQQDFISDNLTITAAKEFFAREVCKVITDCTLNCVNSIINVEFEQPYCSYTTLDNYQDLTTTIQVEHV